MLVAHSSGMVFDTTYQQLKLFVQAHPSLLNDSFGASVESKFQLMNLIQYSKRFRQFLDAQLRLLKLGYGGTRVIGLGCRSHAVAPRACCMIRTSLPRYVIFVSD